jgi:membrane associated rhomboid family serine protease
MPMNGLLIAIGAVFGVLAAACAYFIALNEYRQRMLRLDQNPRRMAMQAATVTFVFILIASVVLSFVLQPGE